jgi:hypothetical protein
MDPNKPDRFCRLRALLVDVFDVCAVLVDDVRSFFGLSPPDNRLPICPSQEPSPEYLAQLHSELDQARPFFLRLLEVPNRNKAEEEELKKGAIFLHLSLWKRSADCHPVHLASMIFRNIQI